MFDINNENKSIYFPFTPICNNFIEKYITNSNHSFVIIYIYLLKVNFTKTTTTTKEVASEFKILQADVLNALDFWKEKGIIEYTIDESDFINIKFLPIPDYSGADILSEKGDIKIKYTERPGYTEEEIDFYTSKEEVIQLFKMAERIFARTFSYTDKLIILGLYDWLGLSMEVLAILFTYCATNAKTNLRYIEKTAINWAEMGINSTKKAEEYIKLFSNEYRTIMNSLGIPKNREPIEWEMNTMKTWVIDFKMPIDVIKEACHRTILNTGDSSFNYTDTIIKKWHEKGVKNIEDIKKLDEDFSQNQKNSQNEIYGKKAVNQNIKRGQAPINQNRFVNYKQPEYDFEKLRKLEIKRLKERGKDDN